MVSVERRQEPRRAGAVIALSKTRQRINDDMSAVNRTETMNVWFPEKHYGFIHQELGGRIIRVFLHEKNIKSGVPSTGARVQYKVVETSKGLMAVDAVILPEGGVNNGGAR